MAGVENGWRGAGAAGRFLRRIAGRHRRMNVLVTGGAGYVGSHTAKALALARYTPVTYDNLSTGHQWAVRWGPFIQGDVGDHDLLVRTLREYSIETVIHFAASAYVGESVHSPAEYFQNNSVNSLTLLNAMRETGTRHIIFSSTCATYGATGQSAISERHSQNPVNPYGESKRFVERALQWYGLAYGIRWAALRYFNAAGADPDGDIGEAHDPETHLIPLAIRAALCQTPPLEVKGVDYPTHDGTAIRDYVHVMDLASAHIRGLEYLSRGGESMALNLGTGHGHSVREVIRAVERVSGRPVPFREAGRREGDPPSLVAKTGRGRRTLGWTPRYLDIDEIARTAWNWHVGRATGT
jgi:UDP-arabinose 4-epimerase